MHGDLDDVTFRDQDISITFRDCANWEAVSTVSPYFTELEAARYCRCGVKRLRSWVDRGILAVRTDVDGRRFYLRSELDAAMEGGAGQPPPQTESAPAVPPPRRPAPQRPDPPSPAPAEIGLPWTDPELDTKKRARRRS